MTRKWSLLAVVFGLCISPCLAYDNAVGIGTAFIGIVESLPSSGSTGEWTIGGRSVTVGDFTDLEAGSGPLVQGTCVKVKGVSLVGKRIRADEIASRNLTECVFLARTKDLDDEGGDNEGEINN